MASKVSLLSSQFDAQPFSALLWLGPLAVTPGSFACQTARARAFSMLWQLKSIALLILKSSGPPKMVRLLRQHIDKLYLWSSLDIPPRNNQRINKLYNRNLDVQIFQKVRCTLRSLSTKRSLPRRSGRSPLGFQHAQPCNFQLFNFSTFQG